MGGKRLPTRGVRAIVTTALAGLLLVSGLVGGNGWAQTPQAPAGTPAAEVEIDPGLQGQGADLAQVPVLVQARPGRLQAVERTIERHGGTVLAELPVADSVAARLSALTLERLRQTPDDVMAVLQNREVKLNHTAAQGTAYDDSFFPQTVGAAQLRARGVDGHGVGVALIDTGITPVADFAGRIAQAVDLSGEGDGIDRHGHGTFVAGILAGDGSGSGGAHAGVAPGAHLVSIKIARADGSTDLLRVLSAIQYAVGAKDRFNLKVLNLPLGIESTRSWTSDPLNAAVEGAWRAGLVVVVAAGNAGPAGQTILKPGDDPLVITVGASDSTSTVDRADDTVAPFSSRGPTRHDGLAKPDLVAPGAHLIGLRAPDSSIDRAHPEARVDGGYFRGSGTSFSTAVVAGSVALLRQAHPEWTPDQVKGALLDSAAAGPVGSDTVDGRGALDVEAASSLAAPRPANQTISGTSQLRPFTAGPAPAPRGQGTSWQGWSWQGWSWQGWSWQGWSWQGTSWQGWSWAGTSWQGNSWQGTSWQGTSWQGWSWAGTSWQGNSWQGTSWQ